MQTIMNGWADAPQATQQIEQRALRDTPVSRPTVMPVSEQPVLIDEKQRARMEHQVCSVREQHMLSISMRCLASGHVSL